MNPYGFRCVGGFRLRGWAFLWLDCFTFTRQSLDLSVPFSGCLDSLGFHAPYGTDRKN